MNRPIIIGGGIAGLATANYLVDHNIKPIIIEANIIGLHKVCGEFFSAEAVPFLNEWNCPLILIDKTNFYTTNSKFSFKMPKPSGSIDHSLCELILEERAARNGTEIFRNTKVINIIPALTESDLHTIELSNGAVMQTNNLIVATGRIPSLNKNTKFIPKYFGIKAHFKNINISNELHMFLIKNAYMGVSFVDNKTVNVCCLAKKTAVEKFDSPQEFITNFIKQFPQLNCLNKSNQLYNWITVQVPEFGKKQVPDWPNCYFIGDAAATIFPASGNGLAMSITSGVMAAKDIISNLKTYKKDWNLRYLSRLKYAKFLNYLFMHPAFATLSFKIAKLFPFLFRIFFKLTRDKYE